MTISAQGLRVRDPFPDDDRPAQRRVEPSGGMLGGVLSGHVRADPGRALILGENPVAAGSLQQSIGRLAGYLAGLGLKREAPIALCLPGGRDAIVALLAAEQAGLVPVLLPLDGDWPALARLVESLGIQAAITTTQLADERPAERLREIAAGYFRLRFPMAFGPDTPDGVASLSSILDRADDPSVVQALPSPGLITLTAEEVAMFRPWSALVAAAGAVLSAARIGPNERLLSLIAPDDLAGLVSGPVAALLSGAAVEPCGVFDGPRFLERLRVEMPTHLVAPGWMEPVLARLTLPQTVRSLVLVHRAPTRFGFQPDLGRRVVDVLAFGETAILAAARQPGGLPALSVDLAAGIGDVSDLLQLRTDRDGTLSFSGPAAGCAPTRDGLLPDQGAFTGWHVSRYKADMFAGLIVGIS